MLDSLFFPFKECCHVTGLIFFKTFQKQLLESACSILQELAKSNLADLVPKYSATPPTRFKSVVLFLND